MALSSSQQLVVAFTAVLLVFVLFPRMFGGGREAQTLEQKINRRGPGPGSVRSQHQIHRSSGAPPNPQSVENMQQMKKLMEQELKSDKYKGNSGKGYVFTLMPLYAIGVGLFAAYKFLKIKSASDSATQKAKTTRGGKKSEETETQLNELEQRLAQTEKMLNSILTQLDPLTNCVKSVAMEQKDEIMAQLHFILKLSTKPSCEGNLEELIETLSSTKTEPESSAETREESQVNSESHEMVRSDSEEEEEQEEQPEEDLGNQSDCSLPSLEDCGDLGEEDANVSIALEELSAGLRRRNRPEDL
ncbi:hypothetical protein DNTS_006254 [Danionella cerebrum]|uniref:Resistance to inhibitors of cholinesterase protein 3 N-terminal domain-containing protein n=1 Tax=Danionella cerebrum TaxID=2873325 RepID=A0A553QFI0_9TELE|nr:hypothetical protein DNTS_006254 [Danionella translucida]TRY88680.1 hypothetical protein DNTS_006254 [Danionella translucida]